MTDEEFEAKFPGWRDKPSILTEDMQAAHARLIDAQARRQPPPGLYADLGDNS